MAQFTLQIDPFNGPVILAGISVSSQRRTALEKANLAVPELQEIRALIDTGASATCIDPAILEALNLTPTGTTLVHTPSSGGNPEEADQYDVAIVVPGWTNQQQPLVIDAVPVIASVLSVQGIEALIGRDILGRCLLVYNGSEGRFTLAF